MLNHSPKNEVSSRTKLDSSRSTSLLVAVREQRRNSAAARRSSIPSVCDLPERDTQSRRAPVLTDLPEGDAAERARQAGSPVEERGVHVPQEGRPAGATKLLGHRVELPRRQHAGGGAERRRERLQLQQLKSGWQAARFLLRFSYGREPDKPHRGFPGLTPLI